MRNVSRILAIVGVAVALVVVATPASANCIPAKLASTFNSGAGTYVYVNLGSGVTAGQLSGKVFQADNPANGTTAAYPASEFCFVEGGGISCNVNLGDARVNGCPAGKVVLQLEAPTADGVKFISAAINESPAGTSTVAFDLSSGRPVGQVINGASLPRPRVTASNRAGTVVSGTLGIDSTAGGNVGGDAAAGVTGYDIVRAAGSTDPGRDPANWTFVQNVATTDGAAATTAFTADCSAPGTDQWFALRLTYAGGVKSNLVSNATRVNCNPALAEPRFNVVPKKPTGPKKQPAR